MATIPELVTLVNLAEFKSRMVDLIYPVGSILQIENTTFDPNDRYPGTTWTRVSGVFLFASDGTNDGETGGEATHELTVDEMPNHRHRVSYAGAEPLDQKGAAPAMNWNEQTRWIESGNISSLMNEGGGQPHNNMPPYRKVSMWRRTA